MNKPGWQAGVNMLSELIIDKIALNPLPVATKFITPIFTPKLRRLTCFYMKICEIASAGNVRSMRVCGLSWIYGDMKSGCLPTIPNFIFVYISLKILILCGFAGSAFVKPHQFRTNFFASAPILMIIGIMHIYRNPNHHAVISPAKSRTAFSMESSVTCT